MDLWIYTGPYGYNSAISLCRELTILQDSDLLTEEQEAAEEAAAAAAAAAAHAHAQADFAAAPSVMEAVAGAVIDGAILFFVHGSSSLLPSLRNTNYLPCRRRRCGLRSLNLP
jgi:hypothetical protein